MSIAKRNLKEFGDRRVDRYESTVIRYHLFGNRAYRFDFKDGSSVYMSLTGDRPDVKVNGFSDSTGQDCANLIRAGGVDIKELVNRLVKAAEHEGYVAPSLKDRTSAQK